MRSLGVDVSERRGLDLVLLQAPLQVAAIRRGAEPRALPGILEEWRPDVVAVDAPPAWAASGASRAAERALAALAIQSFRVPSAPEMKEHAFNGWMRVGIEVHGLCQRAGFARYAEGAVERRSLEVFPHATAVVLAGGLPPRSLSKKDWRESVLAARGVDTARLTTPDLIDAALAALTGLLALQGDFTVVGNPDEGVIVLPARKLPAGPYRRLRERRVEDPQAYLPRFTPCACGNPGCREMTSGEFAPGHDAKRKSLLWERVRQGEEARNELKRRGWEPPPELRPPRGPRKR
jgi:predicted RNase H-like nuclease